MSDRIERGRVMRNVRKAADMSLDKLAQLSGVTGSTIRNWEKGRSVPSMDALLLVSKALGVSIDVYVGNAPLPERYNSVCGRWLELVCFARDPDASGLVRPIVYMCSRCGRLQYEKSGSCQCGAAMEGGVGI